MKPVTTAIEFFSEKELACKGSGVIKLDPRFAKSLVELRKAWGEPITANSVCRTPEHNKKVKGHPRSFHLTENPTWHTYGTMAIDCAWNNWEIDKQLNFARLAWSMGFSVGLHNSFCHLDRRGDLNLPALPQNVFIYGSWNNRFNALRIKS
jgi:zinc D-Ala-D-Ala carboxypeptidase